MNYLLLIFISLLLLYAYYRRLIEKRTASFYKRAKEHTKCRYTLPGDKRGFKRNGTIYKYDPSAIYAYVRDENTYRVGIVHRVYAANIYPPKIKLCGKWKLGKKKSSQN